MNTRNLMRKLPSYLLGAIFAAGIASTTVNAVDGDPPGLFELDGNIPEESGVAGDDWDLLHATGGSASIFTGITGDPAPASIFTQGGSKDVNDVSQWKHTDGSVPDKDDITNAYAAAYINPDDVCVDADGIAVLCTGSLVPVHEAGDLIIYFGLDRLANNGDAHAGFWFFQNEVGLNGDTFVDSDGNPATHVAKTATTPGDVFIVVGYPQGANAEPIIKVYEWDPNDVDNDKNFDPTEMKNPPKNVSSPLDLRLDDVAALCDGDGGKLACAITNPTDDPSFVFPENWSYTPKSGSGLPHESFYEGGINVTKVLGSTPCFASFLAETRSAESQTAQLKDFVLDDFPVCGAEVTKACPPPVIEGDVATVDFNGLVTNTGGQAVFIELTDNVAGSQFTAVCIDDGNNQCGDIGDTVPSDLNALPASTATFTLGVGKTARYEGSYTESPIVDLSFSDTVTMEFFADSTSTQPLGGDTAEAICAATVQPHILVTKVCDPEDGGVRLVAEGGVVLVEVDNKIIVKNDGEEKLINVLITDSEPVAGIQGLADDSPNISCNAATGECTGFLNIGEEVTITQTYRPDGLNITGNPDNPNTVFFNDTATAEGEGDLSGGLVSDEDDASCELCPPDDPVP